MEINENQKPSPAPFVNDFEKPSDVQLESFVRKENKKETLFSDEFVRPIMTSKTSDIEAGYWTNVVISNGENMGNFVFLHNPGTTCYFLN